MGGGPEAKALDSLRAAALGGRPNSLKGSEMRKFIVSAATALALAAAPAVASAQAAAPASAPAASEIQPASEDVTGSELRTRGFILPLLVVIGIIAALYLSIDEDEIDFPVSP